MLLHHPAFCDRSIREIERRVMRVIRIEFGRPVTLEVDCVDEEHYDLGRDIFQYFLDPPFGIIINPIVDNVNRLLIVEIKRLDLGIKIGLIDVDEFLFDRKSEPGPYRIGNPEFHFLVEAA